MPSPGSKNPINPLELQFPAPDRDRRAQPRSETSFSRIEDATYAILRQHEKKPA